MDKKMWNDIENILKNKEKDAVPEGKLESNDEFSKFVSSELEKIAEEMLEWLSDETRDSLLMTVVFKNAVAISGIITSGIAMKHGDEGVAAASTFAAGIAEVARRCFEFGFVQGWKLHEDKSNI